MNFSLQSSVRTFGSNDKVLIPYHFCFVFYCNLITMIIPFLLLKHHIYPFLYSPLSLWPFPICVIIDTYVYTHVFLNTTCSVNIELHVYVFRVGSWCYSPFSGKVLISCFQLYSIANSSLFLSLTKWSKCSIFSSNMDNLLPVTSTVWLSFQVLLD